MFAKETLGVGSNREEVVGFKGMSRLKLKCIKFGSVYIILMWVILLIAYQTADNKETNWTFKC